VRSSVASGHECLEAVEFEWRALLEGEETTVVDAPLSIVCDLVGGRERRARRGLGGGGAAGHGGEGARGRR
jgi:hypothetical protein